MGCTIDTWEKGNVKLPKTVKEALTGIPKEAIEVGKLRLIPTNNLEDTKEVKSKKVVSTGGFQGYIGGFDGSGKGTPEGDGKDKAMREVADGFIGEITKSSRSSTKTSRDVIKEKNGRVTPQSTGYKTASAINYRTEKVVGKRTGKSNEYTKSSVVMLARNGSLKDTTLHNDTKKLILQGHKEDMDFIVGDMPGVDSQFIDYLDEIGASYKIYHTGETPRIAKTEVKKEPKPTTSKTKVKLVDTMEEGFGSELYNHIASILNAEGSKAPVTVNMDANLAKLLVQESFKGGKTPPGTFFPNDMTLKLPDFGKVTSNTGMVKNLMKELNKSKKEVEARVKELEANTFTQMTQVHEMIHAATSRYINTNPNDPYTKRLEALFEEVKAASTTTHKGLMDIQAITDKDGNKRPYWKEDIHEFIAVALSNKDMIDAMKDMKTAVPAIGSVLEGVIATITGILKKMGIVKGSVHEMLMGLTVHMANRTANAEAAKGKKKSLTEPEETAHTPLKQQNEATTKQEAVIIDDIKGYDDLINDIKKCAKG